MPESIPSRLLSGVASIGHADGDSDALRAQKAALVFAVVTITALSTIWVATFGLLGLPTAAAIPLVYQAVSIVGLVAFARTRRFSPFRLSQAAMMTVFPFLLQWTLGGYVASSAISLWGLVGAIGTLFFFTTNGSVPWFATFLGLTVVSGVIDPQLARTAARLPEGVTPVFFVLNVTGVAVTAYVLLQFTVRARDDAYARSEGLLLNILPKKIADRLKHRPGVIAEAYPAVTVLFADVVDFTPFAERTPPERVVGVLDMIFTEFDRLAAQHGVEKIKTIGDAYMAAAGLPEPRPDHAHAVAAMALEMHGAIHRVTGPLGLALDIRIGIHSGPVVAGVIGRDKFIYDLWGDTVNTASRLESHGVPGAIQVSEETRHELGDGYRFEDRGQIALKGKGRRRAYLLLGAAGSPADRARAGLPDPAAGRAAGPAPPSP